MIRRAGIVLLAAVVVVSAALGLRRLARSRTVQLFGTIVSDVPVRDSLVALTFDDGPVADVTPHILDTLRSRGIRATFFVTGAELARAPAAGRTLVEAGHELGNHSYSHQRLVFVVPRTIRREIASTDSLIRAAGFEGPIYVRPPYGYKLLGLPLHLARTQRITVMWSVEPDSYPTVAATADGIVRHVMERVQPGAIILLHPWYASRATSREAIPMLIDSLAARGYRLTTVGEMLGQARGPPPTP